MTQPENKISLSCRWLVPALTAASYGKAPGAHDRVQTGIIGLGLIAGEHLKNLENRPDVDIAAV